MVVAWNEIEGMKAIMPKIKKGWVDQILVVDGGSKDGTVEYSKKKGYDVYVQKERGLHSAYREAWPYIKGDYVITFSPDGNSPPEDIPVLIEKVKQGYDMVIGSRYYKDATSEDDDIITGFGNWLFTSTINLLFRSNYTDAMTIYRIYRKDLFYKLNLDKIETYSVFEKLFFTKIGIEPILSARFAKEKLKCIDIPSPEPKRIGGERKLQILRWGLAYMTQIICERFKPRLLK
jgi:glycosyltransferase involved in cell wall biosynthesis